MLERMLSEVEKQEKLFGLDLDILEDSEPCINTLTLEPSSDAIIEIPIKKRSRVYETKQEILLNEDDSNYETIQFEGLRQNTPGEVHSYDLIQFVDDKQIPTKESTVDLDEIQKSVTQLLLEVEQDEAVALLNQISEEEYEEPKDYKYPIYFKKPQTASSESLSDCSNENYPDSWDSDDDVPIDYDYEPILSRTFENRTSNDVWWEGTYRNLSIVPEEDEENISLLGSCYSNKSFGTRAKIPNLDQASNKRYSFNSNSTVSARDTSMDDYCTDTSKSRSTDDSDYSAHEKIVKAEVKILVKTSEKGRDEIEIRSVREFMDPVEPQIKNKAITPDRKKLCRSQTLPAKLTHKFTGITNKVSNVLKNNKRISKSYGFLNEAETDLRDNNKTVVEKPVFTLQRLFVRTPEAKEMKNFSTASNIKEKPGSRTELRPLPPERYPLQYDPSVSSEELFKCEEASNVNLYANTPFYPCYELSSPEVETGLYTNPFTTFISNPFLSQSSFPQAYCDWLSAEDEYRGNVKVCFRAKTHTHGFDFVVF